MGKYIFFIEHTDGTVFASGAETLTTGVRRLLKTFPTMAAHARQTEWIRAFRSQSWRYTPYSGELDNVSAMWAAEVPEPRKL